MINIQKLEQVETFGNPENKWCRTRERAVDNPGPKAADTGFSAPENHEQPNRRITQCGDPSATTAYASLLEAMAAGQNGGGRAVVQSRRGRKSSAKPSSP